MMEGVLMTNIPEILQLARQYAAELPPPPPKLTTPEGAAIAGWIDHTLLAPEATAYQIKSLCQEAVDYEFAAVCVNPVYAQLASGLLAKSPVKTCTVVGFPLGATTPSVKVMETQTSIDSGAEEIDMVLNIGALKGEAYGQVLNDIQVVTWVAHNQGAIVKVILETALLTNEEKIIGCLFAKEAGADFVKTSTGFNGGGATVKDVDLMRRVVGEDMGVKASVGIRSYKDALAMIDAGANRIGTSSGVTILQEAIS